MVDSDSPSSNKPSPSRTAAPSEVAAAPSEVADTDWQNVPDANPAALVLHLRGDADESMPEAVEADGGDGAGSTALAGDVDMPETVEADELPWLSEEEPAIQNMSATGGTPAQEADEEMPEHSDS